MSGCNDCERTLNLKPTVSSCLSHNNARAVYQLFNSSHVLWNASSRSEILKLIDPKGKKKTFNTPRPLHAESYLHLHDLTAFSFI